MSLSSEERALIEAYIAKKGVTRCPDATYTPMTEIRFLDKKRNVAPDPAVVKRNKLIDRLYEEGLTQRQICEALCINQSIVSNRVQWIRYKATLSTPPALSD